MKRVMDAGLFPEVQKRDREKECAAGYPERQQDSDVWDLPHL